jgi:sortase A
MPRILPLLLAIIGAVLFGHGAFVNAKAYVAQVLLERAFAATIASGHPVKPWSWADSGQALAFGPGHVELTAEPGARGTAVYAAHRDTHFRFLRDVRIGDEIDVTSSDGQTFRYRADTARVVRFDASGIDPLTGGRELVLSTCWPFDAVTPGPERYILHATLIGAGA